MSGQIVTLSFNSRFVQSKTVCRLLIYPVMVAFQLVSGNLPKSIRP